MIVNTELANSKGHLLKDLWETPDHVFDNLNKKYKFTLDPCCTFETRKAPRYFTPDSDGLIQSWHGEIVFVNPPYSRGNIDKWMKKCLQESTHARVIALVPVSTSSKWFHEYVWNKCSIEFVKG
jgi:site-specific DNA-methyltransferase (adenine-specific)